MLLMCWTWNWKNGNWGQTASQEQIVDTVGRPAGMGILVFEVRMMGMECHIVAMSLVVSGCSGENLLLK